MDYKHINIEYLEMVTGKDKYITAELISIFKTQVAEFHNEMESLYRLARYGELGKLAHKAKSSVSIMGIEKLASDLKEMEINAKDEAFTETFPAIISSFGSETAAAINELDNYLESL